MFLEAQFINILSLDVVGVPVAKKVSLLLVGDQAVCLCVGMLFGGYPVLATGGEEPVGPFPWEPGLWSMSSFFLLLDLTVSVC